MSILPHVAVGASVGYFTSNIPEAIGGGYISHLVLDFLPHWDPNVRDKNMPRWRKILYIILFLIDLSLGLGLLWLLRSDPNMMVGGFVGAFTDLDNFLHLSQKIGIKTHVTGSGWQTQVGVVYGLSSQCIVTLLALYFLYVRAL